MAGPPLPNDVAQFVEHRDGCDHFRGEIPEAPDADRMDEINRELDKLCKGTDKKLRQLKQKYAAKPDVMAVLAKYEPAIEPSPRRRTH
jgi:hypothetical protein